MKFNQSNETKKTNSSLRTNYYRPLIINRRNHSNEIFNKRDIHKIIRNIKKINNDKVNKKNIGCQTHYSIPYYEISKNKNKYNFKKPKIHRNNSTICSGSWETIISRTSNKNINKKILNSKTYQSRIFENGIISIINLDKRMLKNAFSPYYNKKTQINTLPGSIKRNKLKIKDEFNFRKKNNISYIYKMLYDFDLGIDYNKPTPVLKGYNINTFPIKQRFYGTYQKGVINHDIFHLNRRDEIKIPHKRFYRNNSAFNSHIFII